MQLHIEKEEISTEVSSSSINIDEECYHINSICEEMFNILFSSIMTQFGLDIKFHKYLMDFFINL